MQIKSALASLVVLLLGLSCVAQEDNDSKPIELEVLKASVGVWDAEAEVWPQGPDSASTKFNGVETVHAYGEYWIASDSEFMGMKLHSIVGYDLDQKQLVGMVIDHGPYSASMTGEYDQESKAVHWITNAKEVNGTPIVQNTTITQNSADERTLVLKVPGKEENEWVKFMRIRFVKRKTGGSP